MENLTDDQNPLDAHEAPDSTMFPDPADRPVEEAARTMARCMTPAPDAQLPAQMLRELRAAMAEFSPGGVFRTSDTKLAAQSAVLDTMFYSAAQSAIRRYTNQAGDEGDIYLDETRTRLALRIQNQYRLTVEGLKSDYSEAERIHLAHMRLSHQRNASKR